MDAIEKTNWLAHRWPIDTEIRPYGQWNIFTGRIEGQRVGQRGSQQEYDQWLERARPICLARFIASRSSLHPAAVLITSGTGRLGRIPAELWCGYQPCRARMQKIGYCLDSGRGRPAQGAGALRPPSRH